MFLPNTKKSETSSLSPCFLCNLNVRRVLRLAEKKTQPVKLGHTWLQGLRKNMACVSADMVRKHRPRLDNWL